MRFRYPLALALLIACESLAAAPSVEERRTVALALDFCGVAVGQEVDRSVNVAKRLPGLNLDEPKPLRELIDDAETRAGLNRIAGVEDETKMRLATFDAGPSALRPPYALYDREQDLCLVIGAAPKGGEPSALRERINTTGSLWTLKGNQPDGAGLWEQPAPLGEKVALLASWDNETVVVSLAMRPVATLAQIAGTARAALDPCLAGIITAKTPQAGVFAPTFALIDTQKAERHEEVTFHTLRAQVDGPRSVLLFNTYRDYTYCEFWTSDARQPTENVLNTLMSLIEDLPDAKEVKAKTKGEEPELRAWRVKRKGAVRYADISISMSEGTMVKLKIESAGGLFR